jgi:ABC-2 type transport system permease protein
MTSQPEIGQSPLPQPGVPRFRGVNWAGLRTLYVKEVRRFFKVHLQTIWAPAITTLLFLTVFTVSQGARAPVHIGGRVVGFASFIAPGLIISTGMMQNAFANASFSLLAGKLQGTIVDFLMPPLSPAELLAAIVGGAVTRAFAVGAAVWLAMLFFPGLDAIPRAPLAVLWFGLLGSLFMAFLGVLTSLWAEKFDHAAAVTNFVVMPLTLLSGTFYSVDRLAPTFRTISHFNPIFYIISGFRYGFVGVADSPVFTGGVAVLALVVAMGALCYWLLRTGWRIKS